MRKQTSRKDIDKIKRETRIIILLFLFLVPVLPAILNFNPTCQVVMALCPFLTAVIFAVIFYLDFGHWPWQKEKKIS